MREIHGAWARRMATLFLLMIPMAFDGARAGGFDDDFAVVMITPATESRHGKIPLNRALLARAIDAVAAAGAKGVVLKFFVDQPRQADSDARLQAAISRTPALLQARIDDSELRPKPLPERDFLPGKALPAPFTGKSGWIPLPAFSDKAHGVCFVDFDSLPAPLLETYQGRSVKSLLLCAVELATGAKANLSQPGRVTVGKHQFVTDMQYRVAIPVSAKPLPTIEFNDVLDGKTPAQRSQGKVVILAYDGPNMPVLDSPLGKLGAHRYFVLLLRGLYELQ